MAALSGGFDGGVGLELSNGMLDMDGSGLDSALRERTVSVVLMSMLSLRFCLLIFRRLRLRGGDATASWVMIESIDLGVMLDDTRR